MFGLQLNLRSKTLKDRPRSGRLQVISRKTLRKALENNPTLNMTELAKKKKISVATVSRAVENEGAKSLWRVKRPLLNQATQQKRRERCGRLLNDLKHHGNRIIIFYDEKTFTVDPVINKQNYRVVGFDKSIFDVRCKSTSKYPASTMMLGVVASNEEKMPTVWFDVGYRLTAASYKDILASRILL